MSQTILGTLALFAPIAQTPIEPSSSRRNYLWRACQFCIRSIYPGIWLSRKARFVLVRRKDLCHANRAAQSLKLDLSFGLPINALTHSRNI